MTAVAMLVLAGCAGGAFDGEDTSTVALDDAVLAVYLSPQSMEWTDDSTGYVLLVDPDGASRAIETSGMDVAGFVWNSEGLHFADEDADYLLDAGGLSQTSSPKANYQHGMIDVEDSVIGLYNLGLVDGESMADGSYVTELVEVRDGKTAKVDREGDLTVVGVCDDAVFAVAEATGRFRAGHESTGLGEGWGDVMLYQVWPGEQRVVGSVNNAGAVPYRDDAPCAEDELFYLMPDWPDGTPEGTDADSRIGVTLFAWDTTTGELAERPLRTGPGADLALTPDEVAWSEYRSGWVREGGLVWLGADGVLRRSDTRTGRTEELLSTESFADGIREFRAFLGRDWLYVLDIPGEPGADLVLSRYRLDGGEPEVVTRISGVTDGTRGDLVIRGAAIAPEMLRAGRTP
ncbi:hypothetical protein [Myceligenerans indicum]|uniref:Uncharacterized protein n=1 Tax=Myceligenerans indicum TaxID=2593663 RepID=A0ABS1LKU0_9MICO|nr:hypothetical protein [Myceligenerans indicum]MBL0886723.1 hypothetical protein [Myceligenerans indicum]